MAIGDLEALKQEYLDALDAYTSAAEKTKAELGEVRPITGRDIPTISSAWIEAVEVEREAQKVYEAARDAYREAVQGE